MWWSLPLEKKKRKKIREIEQGKGFGYSPASFGGALYVDLLEFRKKNPQSILFQFVCSILIDPTTEESV